MKKYKNILLIIVGALLFLGGTTGLVMTTNKAYALPQREGVADNYVIPGEYSFTPKLISGVTEAVTEYDNTPTFLADNTINYHDVTNTNANKVYVIYKNVGRYQGQIVDMKLTFTGFETVDSSSSEKVGILFSGANIGMSNRHNNTRKKYKIEYYKHNTNEKMNIKNVLVFNDIDGPGNGNPSSLGEEIGFKNFDKVLYYDQYKTHFSISSTSDYLYFIGNCNYTSYEATSGAHCDATVDNPTPKAGYLIGLGDSSNTQEFSWRYLWLGISASPFRIEDPNPLKSVDKVKAHVGDDLTYTIEQYVPSQSNENYYSNWGIYDEIPEGTVLIDNSYSIKDNTGSDVTNKFDITLTNDNKLEFEAKSEELADVAFYNNTYIIEFKVKVEEKGEIISNEATLKNNYYTEGKESNEVETAIVYKVETEVENGTITESDNEVLWHHDKTIEYTPDTGYELKSVTVDGTPVSISTYKDDYTFENVQDDHTIRVVYGPKAIGYTVKYLEEGTNKVLHPPKNNDTATYDAEIISVEEKIDIDNYNYVGANEYKITISEDKDNNEIILYYQKNSPDDVIKDNSIDKTTTKSSITKIDEVIDYKIEYNVGLKDYVGVAKIELIDLLPYEIDEAKSNLDGGEYDKEDKTIKWNINKNVQKTDTGISIVKNIKIVYKNYDFTKEAIHNVVVATTKLVELDNYTIEADDDLDITQGIGKVKIITHHVDKNGKKLVDDVVIEIYPGEEYATKVSTILQDLGYKVKIPTNATGVAKEDMEITYVYEKEIVTPAPVEKSPNTTTRNMFLYIIIILLSIPCIIIGAKSIRKAHN
ncbi:MAG: hypothetical protein IJH13_01820 [Bacilli bacterium]|nr:hypothetical protein [Bacilli bacterium]